MAHINLLEKKRKKVITLNIDFILYTEFEKLHIKNKSKFFNWLLDEYLNVFNKKECHA